MSDDPGRPPGLVCNGGRRPYCSCPRASEALHAFGNLIAFVARTQIGAARWAQMTPEQRTAKLMRDNEAILRALND